MIEIPLCLIANSLVHGKILVARTGAEIDQKNAVWLLSSDVKIIKQLNWKQIIVRMPEALTRQHGWMQ